MGKKALIDTNIFIDFLLKRLTEKQKLELIKILESGFAYSFVTRIELLGFKNISPAEEMAAIDILAYGNELFISEAIIQKTIEIRRTKAVKIPDAIIAATAITEQYILLTKNVMDFKNINRLELETLDYE